MDRYLHPADYAFQARKEIRELLGGMDEKKLILAEQAAVREMKSALKKRYDISKIFFSFKIFDAALVYTNPVDDLVLGPLVYFKKNTDADESYQVFECIETTTVGQSPESHPAKWKEFVRDAFVMMYLVDITLYHLHSKDATRLIPKIREDRYQDVKDWLKMVASGEIDADLPQLATTDENYVSDMRFNSHPVEDQRW